MERRRGAIWALAYPLVIVAVSCTGLKPRVFTTSDAGADAGVDAGVDGGAPPGSACDAGTGRAQGCGCTVEADCANNNCVDRVCCNETASACFGCRACDIAGSVGTCTYVPRGGDPHGSCRADSQGCQAGGCAGDGGCQPADAGIVCGNSCFNNLGVGQWTSTTYLPGVCDGTVAGTCPTTSSACADGGVCDIGGGCRTSCAKDADCIQGFFCNNLAPAQCERRRARSNVCSRAGECQSNVCASGYCQECESNRDCSPTSSRCNAGNCEPCIPAYGTSCEDAGFGSCGLSAAAMSNVCICGTCANARAPRCADASCVCGSTGAPCPRDAGTICTEAGSNGVCKVAPGNPCVNSSDCTSSICDSGLCQ